MPTVQANGVNLYYELTGEPAAPTVVCINGIFQDTTSWALTARALSPHFRTLVYDCRGQGQSDKPHGGRTLRSCTRATSPRCSTRSASA